MRKILLVDDDPELTRITERLLVRAGFEVNSTNHAFGVLNLVADLRPDVVVMDMNMPGLTGTELLQLLRADSELAATRVLFFSGVGEEDLEDYARLAGADGFVHKTAPPSALVQALRSTAPHAPRMTGRII